MKKGWLILLFAALLSCVREAEPIPASESSVEGRPVTITISVPGFEPETKGLDEGGTLSTLRLAVFGGSGYLKEYVQADPVRTTDYTYEALNADNQLVSHTVPCYNFTVTVAMSDSHRIIHFLGNGPEIMPFGYDTAVMPIQLSANGEMGYWQMIDLPDGIKAKRNSDGYYIDKYGEVISDDEGFFSNDFPVEEDRGKTRYVADDETEAAFQGIPLIRNWAKMVLSADAESNFTPIAFSAVNVPSRGAMAPYSASTGFIADYQSRSFPYLEDTVKYPGNLPSGTTFDATIPDKTSFTYFQSHASQLTPNEGVANANGGAVYMYERPAPTASIPPSYVIIYGHYYNPDDPDSEGDYFYKVDLMENKRVSQEGEADKWNARYYPIYRNFKYQIVVKKILSQGHATPAAAAASAGSADVSADVTTSHLSDISDGVGRLHVSPWMAKTFTREHSLDNPLTELSVFFSKNASGEPDMSASSVTLELLPPEDGGPDIIDNLSIRAPYDPSQHENPDYKMKGWRQITMTTAAPGRTVRSQSIRVTGTHEYGRLYRDITITVQPVQPMTVVCGEERIAAFKNTSQSVYVSIPDGLVESMFPLEFVVEPQDRTLSPDNSKPDNNLPVVAGVSISEDDGYAGKNTFQYIKTLSWEEYLGLPRTEDEDEHVWRTFTCWFKSNRNESATTIWVYNEFFDKASDSFINFFDKIFQNLHFTIPIPEESDVEIPLTFEMMEDPDLVYPMCYPTITIKPTGLRIEGQGVSPGEENDTYIFKPTSHKVTLTFISTTSYADEFSVTLEADEYTTGFVQTYRFPMLQLMDGHPLSTSSGGWANNLWSNVAWGYVNRDNNKTVLLGYKDHPNQVNTPITINITSGLQKPQVRGTAVSFPYTPTGPRHVNGDNTYHEFEFRTVTGDRDVDLTFSSPGYITERIHTGRFQGNIRTMKVTKDNVFKKNNAYGFTVANPKFAYQEDQGSVEVVFSEISAETDAKVFLDAGGTYTITITSKNSTQTLFYVDMFFDVASGVVYAPESFTPSVGTVEKYPGSNNQYVWHIPRGNLSASVSFKAPDNRNILMNTMYIKSFNGVLKENGVVIP